jgi:hypothetical protein
MNMMKTSCCLLTLILLTSVSAFAQLPTGTLIHLRGDVGIADSSGKVTSWTDANNPAIKFLPLAPANEPSHTAATINGHQAVTFDGSANYFQGPSIFPVSHDYTLCAVVRINNFGLSNNIISGNTHALFFSGNSPYMLHGNFNTVAGSSIPLNSSPAIIVAKFNQSNQFASFYINGYPADSAFIGTNTDTTIYIGAYSRTSFLGGDLAELFVYPRYLSDSDRVHLEDSLMKKYAILGPQPPDSTFSICPQALELYPREKDDSATVSINAILRAKGFDSVYLKVLVNSGPYKYYSSPLVYNDQGASFSFSTRIHTELSEYSFIIGAKSLTRDSILRRRDSIVCGDVYFVNGQSNSIAGGDPYSNEYCRTFGFNFSKSKSDTLWNLSNAFGNGGGVSVGAFPMRIQRDFVERLGIPTALISGGVGGTAIESHVPNPANPMDLQTIYGSMLYRAVKSGLAIHAKAMFWYQGEANNIGNYFDNFKTLYDAWHLDYPNLKKIYVMQIRPGCNTGTPGELRDLLRSLSDYYPDIITHSTMGLPGHDGCHFFPDTLWGYHTLGDQLFDLLRRDFYNGTDTIGLNSPDIKRAYFTGADHRTIALLFNNGASNLVLPNDTIISPRTESINNYFYVGTDTGIVTNIKASGDTLFLQLSHASNARTITYLPDQVYNDTATTYEGPWITNSRGVGMFSFWDFPIQYNLDVSPINASGSQPFVIYPNPTSGLVKININLSDRSHFHLAIYDELGREIISPIDETRVAGSYQLQLDTHGLGCSSAIVQLEVDGKFYEKRLVIMH